MTKVCIACGLTKQNTEFPKNGKFKDGSTRYRADCKECYNISRKISKKKLNKFLNNTKHRTGEEDGYTFEDWRDTVMHFRGCCAYCGGKQSRKLKLTRDHVVPVSRGGKTSRCNIIPSCGACNSSKSDSDYKTWYYNDKYYNKERMAKIDEWIKNNS